MLEEATRVMNLIEGLFWILLAVCCGWKAFVCDKRRKGPWLAAFGAFLLFGISDFVEVGTGTWWRPWWLIIWKAACIGVLVLSYVWCKRCRTDVCG